METISINTRIQNKHDTEANWLKLSDFIPFAGELIIYDSDATHDYLRFKIGDGITNVNTLKFSSMPEDYIISGSQTTISTEDGGNNVYTFTKADGSTSAFMIKNGTKGASGIYYGTTAPTDPSHPVWINPNGEVTVEDGDEVKY